MSATPPAPPAASPPRSSTPTATPRSSTARCTSRCTCRWPTGTGERAISPTCSRASSPATPTAGRATRRRPRSRRRSPPWRRASATVCFATGMAAIGAIMLALLRGGRPRRREPLPVRQHQQPVPDARGARHAGLVRRRHRRARRSSARLRRRRGWCSSRRSPTRATQVADLARIGALCRARGILYVVDNTMTSPWLFRPKSVGAGLVVNALTKYIGGHGNALAGSLTDTGRVRLDPVPTTSCRATAAPTARLWGITQIRKKGLRDFGGTLAAEQAHHIAVGAETLALRLERQCANARALAAFLEAHPRVRAVHYPGLASHAQHAIARELFRDYGGAAVVRARSGGRSVRRPRPAEGHRAVVEPRRQPHARDPRRAHDLPRDGAAAARGDGHRGRR